MEHQNERSDKTTDGAGCGVPPMRGIYGLSYETGKAEVYFHGMLQP